VTISPAAWAMLEDQLQENVRTLCKQLRLPVQHVYDARKCWLIGWPDLVIIGPGGILFRELKKEGENPTPAQWKVGRLLTDAGADWGVWRPADLLDGTIGRQLAAIAAHPVLPMEGIA